VNSLDWLMQWYASQCNGVWEHGHGVDITTIDNPGWQLTIHTIGTHWEGVTMDEIKHDYDHETEWFTCKANGNAFTGFGGPGQLGAMIEVFRGWIEESS